MTQDQCSIQDASLKITEERYNSIIEEVEDYAILLLNRQGNIQTWNKGAQKIKGYRADEIVGENFRIFYTKADQYKKLPEQLLQRAAEKGKTNDEGWRVRKDGSVFWGSIVITALHDKQKNVIGFTKITRDLSERKNWEETLQAKVEARTKELKISENKFRSLVENQYTITSLLNEKFETIYRSPSAEKILGWASEEVKSLSELIHPDDNERYANALRELIEKPENSVFVTLRIKHKNGNYIWLEGILINKLNDPSIKAVIANFHDITKRKEAEKKSEQNASQLKQAQTIAQVGSWQMTFSTQKAIWSDEACRIYGLPPEENEQSYSSWLSFIHPDDLNFVNEQIAKSQSTFSDSSMYHRIVRKDGTIRYVCSQSTFEFDSEGHPIGLFGAVHDITESKIAAQQKEFDDNNTKALINNTNDMMWSVDRNHKLITCNQAFGDIVKLMSGVIIEKGDDILIPEFGEENLNRFKSLYARAFAGEIFTEIEYNDVPEESWAEISYYPIRKGNEIVGTACYSRDITQMKRAEEKLKIANKELETFVYKSSHDLRGPLSSLLGLITVARMELKDEVTVKYLNSMSELTCKLDNVMSKLVKVMALKDVQPVSEPVDMKQVLDEILHSLKFIEGFSRIKFNINNQLDGPLLTDKDSIVSIMLNLIENAIKYSRHELSQPEINVSISKDKNRNVTITVSDNGIGIAEEAKDKIFDMFYRATNKSKGSGLGLYLVKSTVEKIGRND